MLVLPAEWGPLYIIEAVRDLLADQDMVVVTGRSANCWPCLSFRRNHCSPSSSHCRGTNLLGLPQLQLHHLSVYALAFKTPIGLAASAALPEHSGTCSSQPYRAFNRCRIAAGTDALSKEAQRNATVMFFSLVRCLLASKRVLSEHKLSRLQFEWLLGEVKTRFVGVSRALQSKEAH